MIDKTVADLDVALAGVTHGATIMVGGFGGAGSPTRLLEALARHELRDLTVISNNAGSGQTGLAALIAAGSVRRVVCSYPRMSGAVAFEERYKRGEIELELVPQGTLAERIRAGGAGMGGFYSRTGVGTLIAEGREVRELGEHEYVLELPLRADIALIRGRCADRWGNLTYRGTARNFGPVMATAADLTVAEVEELVPLGAISPEQVITPGIFVDRVVVVRR